MEPIMRPVAQSTLCLSAAVAPAAAPTPRISRAMRCSVCVAGLRLTGGVAITASRQTADDVADAAEESQGTKNEHQPRIGVQPAIEKITDQAADKDRANEDKRQLHGHGELAGKIAGFFGSSGVGGVAGHFIVQRRSAPSA